MNWVLPAAKNSDSIPREITRAAGESAIHLPRSDFEDGLNEDIEKFLDDSAKMINSQQTGSGVQRKKRKSVDDLVEILATSKPVSGPLVLIPRGQRASAQISFSNDPELLVSTNFFIAECKSKSDAIVLSSWMLSVFGQLQLEHSGINQEGMRKLEKQQIDNCFVPSSKIFSLDEIANLECILLASEPLKFKKIGFRELDLFWAKKLSPVNWKSLLDSVLDTLQQMCNERLDS
jgi:hypothetical protein